MITGNRAQSGDGMVIDTSGVGGASMSHVEISGNIAAGLGGGIYSGDSHVTIADGLIRGNRARGGGGGLFNGADVRDEVDGQLRLIRVEVDGNRTRGRGGALVNFDGAAFSIIGSAVIGNRAAVGAVAFNASELEVVNSTLSGNSSAA